MTTNRQPTSAETMRQLSEQTTNEGLVFVQARRIVETLWQNSEQYHAGAAGHAEFSVRNARLWAAAERSGLAVEVKRQLRNAR